MKNNFAKMTVKATGVTFEDRQGKLIGIRKAIENGEKTVTILKREPDNAYDKNAIAVLVKTDKFCAKVGYLPANRALWAAPMMDDGKIVRAYNGHIVGGSRSAKTLGWEFTLCWELPQTETVTETAMA